MHNDLKNVSDHLLVLGLGILAQAQKNALYSSYDTYLDEGVFGVLQSAQAAELLIKSFIAQEHPLLIFSNIPKSTSVNGELLSIEHMFEKGATLQYSELPEKLWAATGYKVPTIETYKSFGKLRNTIQHFALPNDGTDFRRESVKFIYEVIDPLMQHFLSDSAVNYVDIEEPETDIREILSNFGMKVKS
ncbi:hypothetical protein B7978_13195 [Vibrio cholerae]|uniref:hypothetical protein n=1 Tax=Vibrio cholerae TaxID=666 RepID=UPI000A10CCA4|nr:hypothetical protein [Vibrio cholerae]MCU4222319.1 hypothetical protein [Vibrio cholerae]ORP12095.1 hypothetical protein B7978_13195 [Vibrio cholerae]HCZ9577684.1 hypothetical protein [Vibrio cholerae]HCZ9602707.1 hypothetical protein [Vibrio cholerae]HCZ9606366.1 hypothetical protein [Vibrio cholerae]